MFNPNKTKTLTDADQAYRTENTCVREFMSRHADGANRQHLPTGDVYIAVNQSCCGTDTNVIVYNSYPIKNELKRRGFRFGMQAWSHAYQTAELAIAAAEQLSAEMGVQIGGTVKRAGEIVTVE